jgi:exopolysaccharide biosynthesis protein
VRTILISCLALLLLIPSATYAQWEIGERNESLSDPDKWNVVQLEITNGASRPDLQLVYFPSDHAEWNVVPNLTGEIDGAEAAVKSIGAAAGINGGYFEGNLEPLGLLISKGERIHHFQKAKLLSGIFAIRHGRPELKRITEFSGTKGVSEAIQCGPFLVDSSKSVQGLNSTKSAARTFVFMTNSSIWGIGICRSATLAEMGAILATGNLIPGHQITRALNFDGGSSTTLYAILSGHEISSPGLKPVSNYLVIKRK